MPRKNELHGDLAVGTAETTNAQLRRPPTAYNPLPPPSIDLDFGSLWMRKARSNEESGRKLSRPGKVFSAREREGKGRGGRIVVGAEAERTRTEDKGTEADECSPAGKGFIGRKNHSSQRERIADECQNISEDLMDSA